MKESKVWHPFTQHLTAGEPLKIVRAEGTMLYDEKGKGYVDANSSWWVNVHGHAHPHLEAALGHQFSILDHVVFAGVTHPKAEELADRICGYLPDSFERVFFSDNGSTSVEVALKMIFQYWYNKNVQRRRIVAIEGSYHGDTFGAMSVGQRGYFNKPFENFFFDVDYIPFPTKENSQLVLNKVHELFSSGECAGIILEPLVQGAAGMQMYTPAILDQILTIAKENDVFVIFDEVMTGFGRTGKMFAMDHCEIKPDVVCLSKGLTGGVLPLGLTVASKTIFDAFLSEDTTKALLHGHSFTGNPLTCAVSCASLDLFDKEDTWEKIANIGIWNKEFMTLLESYSSVRNVRQQGTILAFEISTTMDNSYFSNVRQKAYDHFLEDGILIRPLGNTIFINPPYSISKEEYGMIKRSILSFLSSLDN